VNIFLQRELYFTLSQCSLNFKKFGYNHRNFPGNLETRRDVSVSSGDYTTTSTGSIERTMRPLYLRGGVNINLSSRDILSLGGSYGKWEMQWGNELHYVVIDTLKESYRTTENFTRKSPSFGVFINFEHKFNTKGHTLSSEVYYSRRDGEGKSVSLKYNDKGSIVEGQRVIERGPSNYFRSKIDYKLPLGENNYLEGGYQWQISRQEDVVDYYSYDTVAMDYVLNEQFHREDEYEKKIHSIYGLYAGQYGGFGFQLGLRGEYTFRNIKELNSRESFTIDENSSSEKFTWSARLGNEFRIGKSTRMQLNFRYRSPEVSLQGKREDFYTVDFGVKHTP